jgi:hypothetical protein
VEVIFERRMALIDMWSKIIGSRFNNEKLIFGKYRRKYRQLGMQNYKGNFAESKKKMSRFIIEIHING